jgi:hypothetical protein
MVITEYQSWIWNYIFDYRTGWIKCESKYNSYNSHELQAEVERLNPDHVIKFGISNNSNYQLKIEHPILLNLNYFQAEEIIKKLRIIFKKCLFLQLTFELAGSNMSDKMEAAKALVDLESARTLAIKAEFERIVEKFLLEAEVED